MVTSWGRWLGAAWRRTGIGFDDLAGTAGAALVVYGVSRWSGPAADVVAGVALLIVALRPAVGRRMGKP